MCQSQRLHRKFQRKHLDLDLPSSPNLRDQRRFLRVARFSVSFLFTNWETEANFQNFFEINKKKHRQFGLFQTCEFATWKVNSWSFKNQRMTIPLWPTLLKSTSRRCWVFLATMPKQVSPTKDPKPSPNKPGPSQGAGGGSGADQADQIDHGGEAHQSDQVGKPHQTDHTGEADESGWPMSSTWYSARLGGLWEQEPSQPCQIKGACLSSPHFPEPYGTAEKCEVSLRPFSVIRVMNFSTEKNYDHLTINGYKYSGSGHGLKGASSVVWSNISWESDWYKAGRGWRICVEKPPTCSDGLELIPVAIHDCPSSGTDLPYCHDAEPGELCEGDGRCGTRKDINNCYDKFYTYPPSRDVYQKVHITTTTSMSTSTTQTLTFTSTTSTTTPLAFRSVGQEWIVGGPCGVHDMCLESPNYPSPYGPNKSCVASLPAFSTIRIDDFVTEKYFDPLTINGYMYSGSGLNKASTVLWSNISWSSDGWNNISNGTHLRWKICLEKPPTCSDGLELIPVAIHDCPSSGMDLPNCHDAEPGELCEGDGRCGTRKDINNCYDKVQTYPPSRDVYQKGNGTTRTSTTRTSTTSTTRTRTSTTRSTSTTLSTTSITSTSTKPWKTVGLWEFSGQCDADAAGCVYATAKDGHRQECHLSLPLNSLVRVTLLEKSVAFRLEMGAFHGIWSDPR